jgi:serine/threonine protein kinase
MGEVWRARDLRLNREVAIKVSAQQFTDRFEREAHAIASLNHTNICTLFDIGPNYLVMELIEGPTLAERITEGPLPVEEALTIARQIADALEAAHEKNIIHRDLKPANVKIRPDGSVKVLDFGLAKANGPETVVTPDSPTMLHTPTQIGVILGTAAYMAPEQARGKNVDKRADIWSFGVVLHEMLTGKRVFEGEDLAETLAAVVKSDPDLTTVPAKFRKLLAKCLQKDPKKRLRDIGDAWDYLGTGESAAAPLQSRFGMVGWIAAALLAVIAAGLGFELYRETRPVDRPLVRLDVDLGANVSLPSLTASANGTTVAISPDGMRLAYVSGTPPKLFTRRLDQSKATEFPGVDGVAPFFSPNSQWIGFSGGRKLNKISVEGGAVVPLADIGSIFTAGSWGEDGSIYVGFRGKGVVRIREGGGEPETVAAPGQGDFVLAFPQILPGGKALLFSAYTAPNPGASSIEVMTLADHHRKTISRGGTFPRYLATPNGAGYLTYLNNATLFAVPFDPGKLETRGTALPILDDVASGAVLGTAQLSVSRGGTLVYRTGSGEDAELLTVAWLDGAGKIQPLLARPGVYGRPSLSPDGHRVALEVSEASGTDIWAYDWQRDSMARLTSTGKASNVVWTPDGRYIVFGATGEGISVTRSDGAGKAQILTQSKYTQSPWSFTPDGKRMAFQELDSTGRFHLWTVPIESDGAGLRAGKPEAFLQTPAEAHHPVFSPDGRWLAYASSELGTSQIYVRAFPDQGGKWQISNSGGAYPMWSRTGHELFFESLDNRLMAAAYTVKGDSLVGDKPRVWSDKQLGGIQGMKNLDLAPDGKRIAALMPATEAKGTRVAQNHVVFLENFLDELLRKAPAGK